MKRILAALIFSFCAAGGIGAQQLHVAGFRHEVIHSGNGMTALAFDHAGRLFVCEKQGRVLLFVPDRKGEYGAPLEFADIRAEVDPENESGLLGIALDPDFAQTRHLYLFYTTPRDQRLVRLSADASFRQVQAGSAKVLLEGLPRAATNHKAGDIHIHPKDPKAIYVILGDDAKRELAPDPDHYHGKLLRLDRETGLGMRDNPFYRGGPDSVRSRVWAKGFRNPFRFAFMPGAAPQYVYVSENGDGSDRLAQVKRGADAGWGREGDQGLINPSDPDTRVLFTGKPCLTAIAIATTGPFAASGPTLYAENWFQKTLRRWKLEGRRLDELSEIESDPAEGFLSDQPCVHATFGPDGSLYMTQTYFGPSTGNHHRLTRVVAEK